jgi:hypothetical protein
MAIYLSEQDLPSLLSAISSKLQIPMGGVGIIYYYDQDMIPVLVNESSIGSMCHEQDIIVRLPWTGKHQQLLMETQHPLPSTSDMFNDHANIFDQYLTVPMRDSYAPSVGSWSDFTDDASSLSMSHMFAQSATLSPDRGLPYDERQIQPRDVPSNQVIDYTGYTFSAALSTISLSSTPMPSSLHIAVPGLDNLQAFPPRAEILRTSVFDERPAGGMIAPMVAETANDTSRPPSRNPPISRTPTTGRPTSLRTFRRPSSAEGTDIDHESAKKSGAGV